jgi:hypothetical protein
MPETCSVAWEESGTKASEECLSSVAGMIRRPVDLLDRHQRMRQSSKLAAYGALI